MMARAAAVSPVEAEWLLDAPGQLLPEDKTKAWSAPVASIVLLVARPPFETALDRAAERVGRASDWPDRLALRLLAASIAPRNPAD